MFDLVKKAMLTGVGLAVMSKEKVEEMARDLAESAKLSSEKGQEFVDEVVGRSEKIRAELEDMVQQAVKDALKKADLPSREDLAGLQQRLEKIESKLG